MAFTYTHTDGEELNLLGGVLGGVLGDLLGSAIFDIIFIPFYSNTTLHPHSACVSLSPVLSAPPRDRRRQPAQRPRVQPIPHRAHVFLH